MTRGPSRGHSSPGKEHRVPRLFRETGTSSEVPRGPAWATRGLATPAARRAPLSGALERVTMSFRVYCFSAKHPARAVRGLSGLTEEQAQAVCRDPETSSRTATGKAARARTRRLGCAWFFGYRKE